MKHQILKQNQVKKKKKKKKRKEKETNKKTELSQFSKVEKIT